MKHATGKHVDTVLRLTRRITTEIDDGMHTEDFSDTMHDMNAPRPAVVERTYRTTLEEVEDEDSPSRRSGVMSGLTDNEEGGTDGESESPTVPAPGASRKRPRSDSDESEDEPDVELTNPFPLPPPRSRPSDYLRSRCPLCFGGRQSADE